MQRGALLLQFNLDDLLGVVPGSASIGHKHRLVQARDGNRDQVADEEERLHESECQGNEEDGEEDVEHSLLRVLGADLHYLLAVFNRSFLYAFKPDVRLDELDRAVGACGDGLHRRTGEPVNDRAAADESQHKRGVQQRQLIHVLRQPVGECHDDGEDHGGSADDRRADQNRLCCGLKGVSRAVVLFEHVFCTIEVNVDVEILL